jgi:hypothetical protein
MVMVSLLSSCIASVFMKNFEELALDRATYNAPPESVKCIWFHGQDRL